MLNSDRFLHYSIAIVTTAISLFLTQRLLWQIQPALYPFFIAAVTISSWYGGLGPGLLATILSTLLSEYFFFPDLYTSGMTLTNLGRIVYFISVAVLICALNALLRSAQRRAEAHFREARRNQDLLLQNQERLRQSEERYRLLIEGVTDYAIFMLSPSGEIVSWSAGAEQLLGYSEAEILGQPFARIFTPEAIRQGLPEKALELSATQGFSRENRWHIRKDGSQFWAHCVMSPLRDEAENLRGFSKIMQDITARTQAERERNQLLYQEQAARIEAESANRSKDEFLAILSHELRTPLTAIVGWLGMIRAGLLDQPKTESALETVERNANLQLQLVEDLLDVSRMIRGDLGLNFSQINFMKVLTAAIEVMEPVADTKAIQLRTIVHSAPSIDLWGDADRLQQVILNLLSNAIKFTPNGGQVTIQLDLLEIEDQPLVQFQVQDTGIGISADFLPYVFERFRQADSTSARSHKGLGLGLAIVQYIVQQHCGTIQVNSPGEGQGTTFTVKLPLLNRDQAMQNGESFLPPASSSLLTNITILVVDDEADVREWLTNLLETRGAVVTAVASVEEAMRAIEEQMPTVLISDLAIPGEDGYTLIQQMRLFAVSLLPKAIALSAYADEESRQKALAAGFQDYLVKPVKPDHLIAAIVRLIDCSADLESP